METALLEELLRSKSFRNWSPAPKSKSAKPPIISLGRGRPFTYSGKRYTNLAVDEKHFAPADLAKAWGLSAEKVRQLFRAEPGVLRIGTNGNGRDRGYMTLRIPQSVAVRVHTRLTAIPQAR
jgi:hypothetical protein